MVNMEKCSRCGNTKLHKVRRSKLKCSSCKYEWRPDKLPTRLDRRQWGVVAKYFVLELSSNKVSEQFGVSVNTTARASA